MCPVGKSASSRKDIRAKDRETDMGRGVGESVNVLQKVVQAMYIKILTPHSMCGASQVNSGKQSACQSRRCGFNPWDGKIPWRRKWQLTPVLLPCLGNPMDRLQSRGSLKSLTRFSK